MADFIEDVARRSRNHGDHRIGQEKRPDHCRAHQTERGGKGRMSQRCGV
jgi:hypothetical protein